MTTGLHDHPSREQLIAFAAGRLDSEVQERIERHVANCERCRQFLQDGPEDTLVERPRDADTSFGSYVAKPASDPPPAEGEIPPPLREHPRYRIVRRLGRGGMGVVYRAEHRLMDRPVALKVINHVLMDDPQAVVRFRTEVKAAARLDHPNIVRAYDAEQADDLHFLVMEYVDGISLAQLVEEHGPLPIPQACILARKIAFGLQHASQHGMVHRDVKPQNVMVTRSGQVKILDFGLARLARHPHGEVRRTDLGQPQRSETALTQVGSLLGTPDYIAPEQADDSHTVDVRADLYSLGCTLYCLLAGRPPFPQGSALQKLLSHRERQPRPLSQLRADVPTELVRTIQKMMAKDPAERFQTPAEVAEALLPFAQSSTAGTVKSEKPLPLAGVVAELAAADEFAGGDLPPTRPPHVPSGRRSAGTRHRTRQKGIRRPRRNRLIAAGSLAAGLILILVLVMTGFFGGAGSPQDSDDPGDNSGRGSTAVKIGRRAAGESRSPRILMVLPHDGFWNPDYEPVRRVLEDNGARVTVASSSRTPALPWKEIGTERPVTPDLLLSEATTADYDAVIFTGQRINAGKTLEYLGQTVHARAAQKLMREMLAGNKYVTSICGGTCVLADAGVLNGRQAAFHQYLDAALVKASGAEWDDEQRVVVSGRVITAKTWDDAEAFARTLLREIAIPR